MGLDEQTKDYIDTRFARMEDDIAAAIGLGHRLHDAKPTVDRQGLEVAYGTIVNVSDTEVDVALDADPDTAAAMFTMTNVEPGDRVACVLVPPSSGIVWGTLGGVGNKVIVHTTSGQVDLPFQVADPDGTVLLAVSPTGTIDMLEGSAAANPAANTARIYTDDNGSGKTRLMVRFSSGAAQQLAIQP